MAVKPTLSPGTESGAAKLEAMELAVLLCNTERCCIMSDFPECDNCPKPNRLCRPTCQRRAIRTAWDEGLLEITGSWPLRYVVTPYGRQLIKRGQEQREEMMRKVAA